MSVTKMFGNFADRWRRGFAIAAIRAYQRWLSPHKGFCCAHRVLHGGRSCSQFVKVAIATRPWPEALQLSRQRFAACGQAKRQLRILRSQQKEDELQSERNPQLEENQKALHRRPKNSYCRSFLEDFCCTGTFEFGTALIPDFVDFGCGECGGIDAGCGDCGCDISG